MVGIHSLSLHQLAALSCAGAAATVASTTSKPVEHHFWKPFPAWYGSVTTITNTITATVTQDPETVVQTEVSTLTVPVVVTATGPTSTIVQTVAVTLPRETLTSTMYRPVYETITQTNMFTHVHTATSISTRIVNIPGEVTTLTLPPDTKTVRIPEYITVASPTTISHGIPFTETITLPPHTETVFVPTTETVCVPTTETVCVPTTETVCVPTTETVCVPTTVYVPTTVCVPTTETVCIPTTETVYVPTTGTRGCGCVHTPNCLPTRCPNPPPPCCKTCQAPVEKCGCSSPDAQSTEREPIPVMIHRKIINKARDFINSEDREMTGDNWKTPSQIGAQYKEMINQPAGPYERYRKENVPCGSNNIPQHQRQNPHVQHHAVKQAVHHNNMKHNAGKQHCGNQSPDSKFRYDKKQGRWIRRW